MRIMQQLKFVNQKGDTLVEVIIAMAVMGLVLGGAYVATNRSLLSTRDAQERSNAMKLAESQIELIKGAVVADKTLIFGTGTPGSFCLTNTTTVLTSSNAQCGMNANGTQGTREPIYHIAITRATNTFTINNTWTSARGNVTNNIRLTYRLYE